MGNSEVGHLTIGAGRVVYQDLVRVSLADQGWLLLPESRCCSGHRARESQRIQAAPPRLAGSRWRALPHRAPVSAAENGPRSSGAGGGGACHPGRPGHASEQRARLHQGARGVHARTGHRQNSHGLRALLHDGQGQAMGASREGLQDDGATARGREATPRRSRRDNPTPRRNQTSSFFPR